MTSQSSVHEKRRPKMLIAVDFGTAYSALSFTNVPKYTNRETRRPLGTVPPARLSAVQFGSNYELSSELAWDNQENQWLWGHAVDNAVAQGIVKGSDRLQLIKLCVEQSKLSEATRVRVKSQLDALPPLAKEKLGSSAVPWSERLITLYLRELWTFARRFILRHCCQFDDSEVECWIGVPRTCYNRLVR